MHQKESVGGEMKFSKDQIATLQAYKECDSQDSTDPRVEALVTELIDRVADKWTMLTNAARAGTGSRDQLQNAHNKLCARCVKADRV